MEKTDQKTNLKAFKKLYSTLVTALKVKLSNDIYASYTTGKGLSKWIKLALTFTSTNAL